MELHAAVCCVLAEPQQQDSSARDSKVVPDEILMTRSTSSIDYKVLTHKLCCSPSPGYSTGQDGHEKRRVGGTRLLMQR